MIQASRIPPVNRVVTGTSTSTGNGKPASSNATSATADGDSGSTSALLVELDSSSRQKALSGSGNSSGNSGENGDSGSSKSPGAASEGDAAVNTAIRTDSAGLEATRSAIDNDTAGLDAAKAAVEKNLTNLASDPKKFQEVLQKSFGGNYDKAAAEKIRQQVLNSDFSWMPKIEVVDASVLQDQSGQQTGGSAQAAYSRDNDTIYISRELLASDPDAAAKILTEEVGHGLDARLNTSDAAGDEGAIFSRLVDGESISDSELQSLKSENDSGTIIVDGKEVEVEFFFKKIFKGVKKAFKGIKKGISKAWKGIKKGFKAVMNSKLFNTILSIAQFIPIPIVQVAVRVINVAKAAYSVYQGLKHKSLGAVFSGVAGVAAGVGSFGASLGASARFVDTANRISTTARTVGAGYAAIAKGDFASAASLASNYFGGDSTQTGRIFRGAGQAYTAVNRAQNGDLVGAISSGANAFGNFQRNDPASGTSSSNAAGEGSPTGRSANGSRSGVLNFIQELRDNKTVRAITENVSRVRGIVNLVRDGKINDATNTFLQGYGDALGIDPGTRQSIQKWANVIERVDGARTAVRNGQFPQAISRSADLLGIPLNNLNESRINAAFGIRDAVLDDRYPDAAQLAAGLATSYNKPELASVFLSIFSGLGGNAGANPQGGSAVRAVPQGEAA